MPLFIPRQGVAMGARDAARALASIPGSSFLDGEEVARFEDAFARLVGVEHAVAVASGRYGLHLAMEALKLTRHDEVVAPSLTIPVVPNVVTWTAELRFADVSPTSYTLDPASAAEACTPRTRALLPTHLFGCPCDMGAILDLAEDRGLLVVEDCAHALGARYRGRSVGALGDVGVFSLATGKQLPAFGGGVVVTDDGAVAGHVREAVAREARPVRSRLARAVVKDTAIWALTAQPLFSLAVFPALALASALGATKDPFGEEQRLLDELPASSRGGLANVQAARGLAGLERLEREVEARRANAHALDRRLADAQGVSLPSTPRNAEHAYLGYYCRVQDRARFMHHMLRQGVDTRACPMLPCASLEMFGESRAHCPTAERLARELVLLPVHPPLGERDMERVARAARESTGAS